MLRHLLHYPLYGFPQFLVLQILDRKRNIRLKQIDVRSGVIAAPAPDLGVEGGRSASGSATHGVASLVGRDGEKPRLQTPGRVEPVRRQVHLQERVLEDIVGKRPIAEKSHEKSIHFAPPTLDKRVKCTLLAFAMESQKIFVGHFR